jgi:hypothetical protein
MEGGQRMSIAARAAKAIGAGFAGAFRAIWSLARVVLPVTLIVVLCDWSGALSWIDRLMAPLMGLLGLPGRSSLVFIASVLFNIYGAIAAALFMNLDLKSATILAIMCLAAHDLVSETAAVKKTGSSGTRMAALRIGMAIVAAFTARFLIPSNLAQVGFSSAIGDSRTTFLGMIVAWGVSVGQLAEKIVVVVLAVRIAQGLLGEFHIMDFLSRVIAPIMRLFGLSGEEGPVWMATNIVDYACGAGLIEEHVKAGRMKQKDADLFNYHTAACQSLFEDTTFCLAVGLPLFWVTVPRLVLAFAIVWLERTRRHIVRRSFRVGTE